MNSFRVDELISSFDDLKPFSDLLFEEAQTKRFHKIYKNLDKYEDSSLLRHLLVLVSFIEHSSQYDPSHIKPLQNYLIELTSVIEKTKGTVSKDHISIAMGILLKHSATLLDMQNSTDTAISVMLHSLAYQHLSSVSPKNAEVSAWIALHLLETTAAISNRECSQEEVASLWDRDDLAEYCVDCLIPPEGGIQRLHAGVYREAIGNSPIILPNITAKDIEASFNRLIPFLHRPEVLRIIVWMIGHNNIFRKMAIFDNVLSKSSIGKNVDFVCSNLTSTDVKLFWVFLLTLALWSGSSSSSVKVPARLRIRADHLNCWKAVCQVINNSGNGNLKWVVLRTRVIDSVRLRCRVVNLTRLYEVFCWLEANDGNESWMTLYATAISDALNIENTYRRKSDELFSDGFSDEKDLTLDDVNKIEEHAVRYLASNSLSKRRYGEAAHRLMYAESICSKKLLLEVYQRWLRDGQPDEQERDQLSKWVRELQAECSVRDSHETTPTPSSPVSFESEVDRDTVLALSRRLQVDASTNTPSRTDVSSPSYDAEESFFSVRSDRTDDAASDHSFASAAASSFGQNAASKVFQEKPRITASDFTEAHEPKNRGSLSLGHPRGQTAQNVLSMTNSQSISVLIPGDHQEKSKELALPEMEEHSPSVPPEPAQVTSSAEVTSVSASPGKTTLSTATTSTANLPPIVANSPFGKFIASKEAATSFWKSGKPVAPVFGAVPPCISSSQQKPEQKSLISGASMPAGLTPPSVPKGTESSSISAPFGTPGTDMSPFSISQKNIEGNPGFLQSSLTPRSSHKPQWNYFTSPHPDLSSMEESPIDDENFYNSLVIEMCKKQLERGPSKSQSTSSDIGALQEKMAQITVQLRNAENQLHSSAKSPLFTSPSTVSRTEPTQAELLREKQRIALAELEQKVAQLLRPPTQPVMSAILSTTHSPLKATEGIAGPSSAANSCADTLATFNTLFPKNTTLKSADINESSTYATTSSSVIQNGAPLQPPAQLILSPLQKMEQLARHPGSDGLCFGCLDDEAQDTALKALDKLAHEWNTVGDSDSD